MTDDQGYGDLGFHGNDTIDTPVLDRLARESVRFDRFFVCPYCTPTRASLMTGRYPLRTGAAAVTRGLETVRSEEVTIAEILKSAGYATGCFGKWHVGEHYPSHPQRSGVRRVLRDAARPLGQLLPSDSGT
jgi:arylsulfatase A